MNMTKPFLALVLGVPLMLAGCATRESVEQAQAAATAADAHAGTADSHALAADSRATDARKQADQATGIGNDAMTAAQNADSKASGAQTGLIKANARIAYLENKLLPHKKHKVVRHKVKHKTIMPGATTQKNT
jgi:hypothetical protein